jgi:hypothetical protein
MYAINVNFHTCRVGFSYAENRLNPVWTAAKFSVHRKFISCGEKIFFLWGENLFSVHRKFSRCGQKILPDCARREGLF